MKIKLTYILSNINKALAFEWIADCLDKNKFNFSFILLNPSDSSLEKYLQSNRINVQRILYQGKKDLPKAVFKIYQILKKEKTQIVHCHLFDACIAGLIAANLAGVKRRIYTRHHATFHQVYFPRAVWYDKLISSLATEVVAISDNVRQTLINEGVNKKIHLIHHGFKLKYFTEVDEEQIASLKLKYNPANKYPCIGVISRYFELKGVQYIIPAFQKFLESYPDSLLILANATGNYSKEIKALLKKLPLDSYVEIPFENDIGALYHLFNIFVHVPIDSRIEAFGQTYVEALAAGIPSIFTLSGIAQEFIEDRVHAMVVPYKNSDAIYDCMKVLLEDDKIRNSLIIQGKEKVTSLFNLIQMVNLLEEIYSEADDR